MGAGTGHTETDQSAAHQESVELTHYHLSHSITVDTYSFPVSTVMGPNEIILNRTMVSAV